MKVRTEPRTSPFIISRPADDAIVGKSRLENVAQQTLPEFKAYIGERERVSKSI